MAEVYLALGSNVDDCVSHIESAKKLLADKLECVRSAPICTSKAVGYTNQPDFKNTVICGITDMNPTELLDFIKQIETKVGRTKTFRWGPREIDIDIIFYDDIQLLEPSLTIPHPRYTERDFVLKPLCDLNSSLIDPKTGKTVSDLLENLPVGNLSIVSKNI